MFKKIVFAAVVIASLGACRDANRTVQDNAAAASPAAAAPAPVAPAVPVIATFNSPLAGGVSTLPFAFHVAIDREVTARKTGKRAREVGIEFLDGNVIDVDAKVAGEFEKVGYARDAGEPQGKSIRSLYKKTGSPDVLVWVRPGAPRGERFKLQQPNAKGTVYLAWNIDTQQQ